MNKIIKLTSIAIVSTMVALPAVSSAYAQSAGGNGGGGAGAGGGNHNLLNRVPEIKALVPPSITKFKNTEQTCDYQWRKDGLLNNFWAFRDCRDQELQK